MFHKKLLLLLLFSFPIIYLVLQKVRRVVLLCSLYHTCLAMWITLLKQHWNTTLLLKIGCNSCSTCVMCHVCGKRRQNWIFLQNKNCHQRNILYFLFSTSVRLTWMSSHPCKYLFMRCFIYFWVQFFFLIVWICCLCMSLNGEAQVQETEDVLKLIGRQKKLKSDDDLHVLLSLACGTDNHRTCWSSEAKPADICSRLCRSLLMKYVFLLSQMNGQ